jgi:hypothetical protein
MWNDRLLASGGILFAVFTFFGVMMTSGGVAGGETTTAEAADWLADSGNRTLAIVGAYLLAAGAIAFAVFLAATTRRMRDAGASSLTVDLARIFGGAFAVLQLAAAAAFLAAPLAIEFENEPIPLDPGVARLGILGISLWLVPGMFTAAGFVTTVAVSSLSAKVFPAWVAWTGLLCAVALLAAVVFLPALLLLLWTLAVSLLALVRGGSVARTQAAGSPA